MSPSTRGSRRIRPIVAGVLAVAWSLGAAACLPSGWGASPSSPSARTSRAVRALGDEDFAAAREDLLWLASTCESGAFGRRAVLLLAAAELDTENPQGSPRQAAALAAGYLVLPDAEPAQVPVARALYRLAADRGGLAGPPLGPDDPSLPVLAARFDSCLPLADPLAPRPLPSAPSVTMNARVASLEAELATASDSVGVLRERNAALEAEIRRIAELLRNGLPGSARRNQR